ncbi:MAG TPA: LysE family transporter, partial [Bacteroidia bacterium]|nr:LysE family transporter [Bacteroidia bacterium]
GSAILFVFGIYTLFQKHEDEKDEMKALRAVENVNKRLPWMLAKGFALNLLNPIVLFMWIGIMANVHHVYTTPKDVLAFFAGTLGMIFILDILKAFSANKLKRLLTHNIMVFIHYVMGIALVICGIVLLYDVFSGKSASA